MLAPYEHFLAVAASSQWDEAAIDLTADAAAWREFSEDLRDRIGALVGAFCVGETAVAKQLEPFERGARDPVAAACFRAQQVDEARHARLFGRLAREVLGIEADMTGDLVEPVFVELFDRELVAAAARLAAGTIELPAAVALYHLLLEGVVFGAGQVALLALLAEQPSLPGMRRGVDLVARDERWHLGLGARVLQEAALDVAAAEELLGEGERVLTAWGDRIDDDVLHRALLFHRRRLRAAGLLPRQNAFSSSSIM